MSFFSMFRTLESSQKAQSAPNHPLSQGTMSQPYTMKTTGSDSAEIILYGDIVSAQPTDWYGNPIEGQFIILSQFLKDFKTVENVAHLTVRIHSAGGNAYDALAIHNKLKEMPADVTVIVDGIAMSGGSIIMCAGNSVKVFPGSLIMIHKCWSFLFDGYNATELRSIADHNDAVDRAQAAVYQSKTNIKTEELLKMMENETYMTGQEAIDLGFADTLESGHSLEIAASADRRTLFIQGLPVWASSRKEGIPETLELPTIETADSAVMINSNQSLQTGDEEGGKIMATNLDEFKKENPDLANALMAEAQTTASASAATDTSGAIESERRRIQEIDEISALYAEDIVQAAKYGDNPCTAQELAHRAAKEMVEQGKNFLTQMDSDTADSKSNDVGALPNVNTTNINSSQLTSEQQMQNARDEVQALLHKEKEV